jgi:NADH:ubiquinone oxidoreductase subunit 6 (subunit J)
MFSLVGVLLGIGATVVAIAQLLFAASLGLVCLFAMDTVAGPANATDPSEPSWHWLVAVFGVAGACAMGGLLVDLLDVVPPTLAADQITTLASAAPHANAFEAVGLSVIVDNGLALLALGLVLLASAVGAGFLASRGSA